MSNVCDQFAEKGRKEVLCCFVENALALGMKPAMVAQIADSSDPFVQAMIAAPDSRVMAALRPESMNSGDGYSVFKVQFTDNENFC